MYIDNSGNPPISEIVSVSNPFEDPAPRPYQHTGAIQYPVSRPQGIIRIFSFSLSFISCFIF